ncbi:hypothetical protein RHMOL_Rhmol04G0127900 [Rhododendron molle]|uniref:Uncharacterized protein n=1 Tax=Rhododendron molle TaxID=49168 RepID=A0ACC0NZP6_RHOML|nr:hypothetical protein RHMOL_Rhmol04G0127900 [Rhododendron molle]
MGSLCVDCRPLGDVVVDQLCSRWWVVVDQKCVEGGGVEDGEEAAGVVVDENAEEEGVGVREGWSPGGGGGWQRRHQRWRGGSGGEGRGNMVEGNIGTFYYF